MLMPKNWVPPRPSRPYGARLCGNELTHGDYGLVAAEPAWATSNQIEARIATDTSSAAARSG